MQFLVFHLGADRYALATGAVLQVLPLLELKRLPRAPEYVAGLMNLQGAPVPVIDLCMLAVGAPCRPHFDTRIIVTDYAAADGARHRLGLMAERVTGVRKLDEAVFVEPGVAVPAAPYCGRVAPLEDGLLQAIDLNKLLTEEVQRILFPHDSA